MSIVKTVKYENKNWIVTNQSDSGLWKIEPKDKTNHKEFLVLDGYMPSFLEILKEVKC